MESRRPRISAQAGTDGRRRLAVQDNPVRDRVPDYCRALLCPVRDSDLVDVKTLRQPVPKKRGKAPAFYHKLTGEDFDCVVEVLLDNGRGKIGIPVHISSSRKAYGRVDYLATPLGGHGLFWAGGVTVVERIRGVPASELPPPLPPL